MTPIKNYSKAKELLKELAEKAKLAIIAIEENRPTWEICNLGVEDIDDLTSQISTCILGERTPVVNRNRDIEV